MFKRGERAKCEVDEESDKGSRGKRMDGLRNCQGMGAAHANRPRNLRNSESHEFEMDCYSFHSIQLHLKSYKLVVATFRSVKIASKPLPRGSPDRRTGIVPDRKYDRRHAHIRSSAVATVTHLLCERGLYP